MIKKYVIIDSQAWSAWIDWWKGSYREERLKRCLKTAKKRPWLQPC